jgi:hypothetical protein
MKSLAIFILLLGYVSSEFSLTILLNEFNNGQGFLANGEHCSSFWFSGIQCNIQLTVSVDLTPKGSDDPCNNNKTTTINLGNVTSNSNRILFSEQSYGSWKNPQIFNNQDGFYDGFQLCVVAREATTGALIDSIVADRIDSHRVNDFAYWSNERLNGTIDPTLTLFAWTVVGDMDFPPVTRPPVTVPTTTPLNLPDDCEDALKKGIITASGLTHIVLPGNKQADVYCEVQGNTAQTVIQSRGEDSANADFDMIEFDDFKSPIGTPGPKNHFWFGLDNMNLLTTGRNIQYNMTIVFCCQNTQIARQFYNSFKVGDASTYYKLQGKADHGQQYGLSYGPPSDFGTKFGTNQSYNGLPRQICPASSLLDNPEGNIGGWWFGSCSNNLNGHYYPIGDDTIVDKNQCTLDQTKARASYGIGIELNNGPVSGSGESLNWISATRVRMAVYRADGNGVPTTSNFCNN